jgi:hypothetical protein
MTTAVAAHRRPGIRRPPNPSSTLGPWHFIYLVAVLLIFGTLFAILLSPFMTRHFARSEVQVHEQAFGFRLALVDNGHFQEWRIVEVRPGGRFAQAGFRSGDVPSERDSNGILGLAGALEKAAAGQRACLTMWNGDPFGARREVCLAGTP